MAFIGRWSLARCVRNETQTDVACVQPQTSLAKSPSARTRQRSSSFLGFQVTPAHSSKAINRRPHLPGPLVLGERVATRQNTRAHYLPSQSNPTPDQDASKSLLAPRQSGQPGLGAAKADVLWFRSSGRRRHSPPFCGTALALPVILRLGDAPLFCCSPAASGMIRPVGDHVSSF
jgi:hypothetical protein